ncbi:endonuclease/exonuclease/phosphatase family protein [Plantactinospora sp. WMMB782]|uniref:endonuclease/exonuclease/phosphatase family protein n=1 Tax=Plantactinospora sp. WMMB782 TaxID=3404121 RepID=UPI003B94A3A5
MTDTLDVLTFNVCGLPSRLRPLAERAGHFCREIEASGADVVNLQEVWTPSTLAAIRSGLPSYPYLAWRRGLAGQPAGGLVTFSRRPVGPVSYRSFRGTRPASGSLRFRAKRMLNGLLQGVLTVPLPGLATVVNTHLSANKDGDWSAGNRYHPFQRAQVEVLHHARESARRSAGAGPTVLTGDFNIASDSPLYPRIVDGGAWRDPFAADDPVTFHAEFLPPGFPARRIDYLLVSGAAAEFPVLHTGRLFTEPLALPDGDRLYVSDHVALTARITVSGARATGSPPRG